MSAYLRQEVGQPWRVACRVRFQRFLDSQAWKPAILDHQELVGTEVGGARLLSPLQGTWHVRNEHHGLSRYDSNLVKFTIWVLDTSFIKWLERVERSVYILASSVFDLWYF